LVGVLPQHCHPQQEARQRPGHRSGVPQHADPTRLRSPMVNFTILPLPFQKGPKLGARGEVKRGRLPQGSYVVEAVPGTVQQERGPRSGAAQACKALLPCASGLPWAGCCPDGRHHSSCNLSWKCAILAMLAFGAARGSRLPACRKRSEGPRGAEASPAHAKSLASQAHAGLEQLAMACARAAVHTASCTPLLRAAIQAHADRNRVAVPVRLAAAGGRCSHHYGELARVQGDATLLQSAGGGLGSGRRMQHHDFRHMRVPHARQLVGCVQGHALARRPP
jgi:hypothetical protein